MTPENRPAPEFRRMGDQAVIAYFGDTIDRVVNHLVRLLFVTLRNHPLKGLVEIIPACSSLLLVFDPALTNVERIQEEILRVLESIDPADVPVPKTVEIPVLYGGKYGPDMEWVARYHSISQEEVIRLHTGHLYHVYMIGFIPGFAYMGELPSALATPRKETPRTAVPRGSVGLAQEQTGIYPAESPGGWQIIGKTPLKIFDAAKRPPSFLQMGDQVRFVSVSEEDVKQWRG